MVDWLCFAMECELPGVEEGALVEQIVRRILERAGEGGRDVREDGIPKEQSEDGEEERVLKKSGDPCGRGGEERDVDGTHTIEGNARLRGG